MRFESTKISSKHSKKISKHIEGKVKKFAKQIEGNVKAREYRCSTFCQPLSFRSLLYHGTSCGTSVVVDDRGIPALLKHVNSRDAWNFLLTPLATPGETPTASAKPLGARLLLQFDCSGAAAVAESPLHSFPGDTHKEAIKLLCAHNLPGTPAHRWCGRSTNLHVFLQRSRRWSRRCHLPKEQEADFKGAVSADNNCFTLGSLI